MPRPKFPAVVDSSLISHFRACPHKAFRESFEHWKPKQRSIHLHAGGAFARGIEVARLAFYAEGRPVDQAVARGLQALVEAYGNFECPADSAKSLERMMGAFEFYFDQYPLDKDTATPATLPGGRRGIEFFFVEPIDVTHPVTGEPLLYCGRFDAIMDYAGGVYGCDEKTTSGLGATWGAQWDLRSQFTAYTWGARRQGIKLEGFLIRGISILKTKYDTQQAITYRPEWMVDRWYHQMCIDVERMKKAWESDSWDFNLDESCTSYGGCPFRRVCQTEPGREIVFLRRDFAKRRWDPVTRVETEVEEVE